MVGRAVAHVHGRRPEGVAWCVEGRGAPGQARAPAAASPARVVTPVERGGCAIMTVCLLGLARLRDLGRDVLGALAFILDREGVRALDDDLGMMR